MKQFQEIALDIFLAKAELEEFRILLGDPEKPELKEKQDLLPFFASRERLIALVARHVRSTL